MVTGAEMVDSNWKSLYKAGGISGILTGVLFIITMILIATTRIICLAWKSWPDTLSSEIIYSGERIKF
jgi:hypothetical protein